MDAALKLDKAGEQQSPKKHPPGLYLLFLTEMWKDLVIMECVAF